jgi:hypothetical protein
MNKLEGTFWSTPALAGGDLFLRASDRLYRVRERPAAARRIVS